MNHLFKYFAYTLSSVAVLGGSFFVFAALSGTLMNNLPGVGHLFPDTEREADIPIADLELEDQLRTDQRTPWQTIDEAASPLRAFLLPAGFSAAELEELENALQRRLSALDLRERELDARERELLETARHYEDLYVELERLRGTLLEEEAEVSAQKEEAARDRQTLIEQEASSYAKMAGIFVEGKAKDSARLLIDVYEPAEAAKILDALDEVRAGEILSAIHSIAPDRSRDYHSAYRLND